MKTLITILLASALAVAALAGPRPTRIGQIKEVIIWPTVHNCADNGRHGNVFLVGVNGEKVQLTTDGLCSQPKVSPDGKTIGWLHGRHHDLWGDDVLRFLPNELVLVRDGKFTRHIPGEQGDFIGWDFANNGSQVAVAIGSLIEHAHFYFLYDIDTLRKVSASPFWERYDQGVALPPEWAKSVAYGQPILLSAPMPGK